MKTDFLHELADLMKKHNASIEIERVSDGEYESHAELYFKIGEKYLAEYFTTPGTFTTITADSIYQRLT